MTFAVTDKRRGPAGGMTWFLVGKGAPGFMVGSAVSTKRESSVSIGWCES